MYLVTDMCACMHACMHACMYVCLYIYYCYYYLVVFPMIIVQSAGIYVAIFETTNRLVRTSGPGNAFAPQWSAGTGSLNSNRRAREDHPSTEGVYKPYTKAQTLKALNRES